MSFKPSYQEQIESPLLTDIFDTADDNDNTIAADISSGNNIDENAETQTSKNAKEVSDNSSVAREISISEALRIHSGHVKVSGIISSQTELQKMISVSDLQCIKCQHCQRIKHDVPKTAAQLSRDRNKCPSCNETMVTNYEFVNAVMIELQDPDTFNEIERLPIALFDEDTRNIGVGEKVSVNGHIQIVQNKHKGKFFGFLYAESIKYEQRRELSLTRLDIEAIERFGKTPKIVEKLVSMTAPSIIGYDHVKEGLLLSAVCTGDDDPSWRRRIHVLLVGETGLAKSALQREAAKLVPNSRYESGQSSSAKSLTAIVSKEDESYVLRLGSVPMAKESICSINEFGRISFDEQAHFLDVMEEGRFTINKYGIHADIDSPTTIIASANPMNNSTWQYDDTIDINEIPAIKPLIDRFDLIFVFRRPVDETVNREYAAKKAGLDGKRIVDYYAFLRKYILFAKQLDPVLNEEAKAMLNEYWVGTHESRRVHTTLYRLAKALARLKLKRVVDAEDARETMQYYNVILQQHKQAVCIPDSPTIVTYNECLSILRENDGPLSLEILAKNACDRSQQVKHYLGTDLKLNKNWKLRKVSEMLVNHDSIKVVQVKPTVLQYTEKSRIDNYEPENQCEVCVVCDVKKTPTSDQNSESKNSRHAYEQSFENTREPASHTSHTSLQAKEPVQSKDDKCRITSQLDKIESSKSEADKLNNFLFSCYYCDKEGTDDQIAYEKHVILTHPSRPAYPGKADLQKYGLKPQKKQWER